MANKEFHVKTNITYSDDCTKRYILDVCWNQNLPIATVVMVQPTRESNGVAYDDTINRCLNMLYSYGYGRAYFVNLLCNFEGEESNNCKENWEYIKGCINISTDVILAYGAMSALKQTLKADVLGSLAASLKKCINYNKRYHILTANEKICMPTVNGAKIESRTFDEILELLGEKRESGDNGQK